MLNHRGEFAAGCVDNDNIALVDLAAEYLLSDDGLNVALDIPLERTRAEARVVACVDYRLLCGVGDVEVKLLVLQASLEGSRSARRRYSRSSTCWQLPSRLA